MQLVLILAGAIDLVVGSLAAAALLSWFLWNAFRLVLHPEWGTIFVLGLLVLALVGVLPKSQFVEMTLAFALFAALPLWFAGRSWRAIRRQALNGERKQGVDIRPSKSIAAVGTVFSPRLYPALTACIAEERSPSRDEVHIVASRLWREGVAQRYGSQTLPASFAARRLILRAATVALSGRGVSSPTSAGS